MNTSAMAASKPKAAESRKRRVVVALVKRVSQESKLETGLGGWGKRIRTSELQKRRPSNYRVRSEGALPPRASRDTANFDLVVLRRATL